MPTIIKKEGEIISLRPDYYGSITHTFRIAEGRITVLDTPYSSVSKGGISFTSAAQIQELNGLIGVLETLRDIVLTRHLEETVVEEKEIPTGTLVETCDKRYGIAKIS